MYLRRTAFSAYLLELVRFSCARIPAAGTLDACAAACGGMRRLTIRHLIVADFKMRVICWESMVTLGIH